MSTRVLKDITLDDLAFHDPQGVTDRTYTTVLEQSDIAGKANSADLIPIKNEQTRQKESISTLQKQIKDKVDTSEFNALKQLLTSNKRIEEEKNALICLFDEFTKRIREELNTCNTFVQKHHNSAAELLRKIEQSKTHCDRYATLVESLKSEEKELDTKVKEFRLEYNQAKEELRLTKRAVMSMAEKTESLEKRINRQRFIIFLLFIATAGLAIFHFL